MAKKFLDYNWNPLEREVGHVYVKNVDRCKVDQVCF